MTVCSRCLYEYEECRCLEDWGDSLGARERLKLEVAMGLRERLKKEQDKKRHKWPTKRFADGSLWRLHPRTMEPVERLEEPDPEKGWKETPCGC